MNKNEVHTFLSLFVSSTRGVPSSAACANVILISMRFLTPKRNKREKITVPTYNSLNGLYHSLRKTLTLMFREDTKIVKGPRILLIVKTNGFFGEFGK